MTDEAMNPQKKSDALKFAFVIGGGIAGIAVIVLWLFFSFVKWNFSITPEGLRTAIAFVTLAVVATYIVAKLKDL